MPQDMACLERSRYLHAAYIIMNQLSASVMTIRNTYICLLSCMKRGLVVIMREEQCASRKSARLHLVSTARTCTFNA